MGNVQYRINCNGRNKTVEGVRLDPFLAAKYIQDKGWLVDHIPSGRLASGAYFQDIESAQRFAEIYALAMGEYIHRVTIFFTVPDELKQFRKFLDRLESYYQDRNCPINVDDMRIVIFELQKESK